MKSLYSGRKRKISLRTRVILTIIGVYILVVAAGVYPLMRHHQQLMREEVTEAFVGLAQAVAASAAQLIATQDPSSLKGVVASVSQQECLRYLLVQGSDGLVLASTGGRLDGRLLMNGKGAGVVFKGVVPPPGYSMPDGFLMEINQPIQYNGREVGMVRMGLSTPALTQIYRNTLHAGVLATLLAVLVGGGMAAFADFSLKRVLKKFIAVTKEMAGGDLTQRVDVRTGDELEDLGESFNSMVVSLKEREGEIRQLKEFNESIVRSITDGILVLDKQMRVTYWNPAMERIYGVPETAASGRSLFEVVPAMDGDGIGPILEGALKGRVAEREGRSGSRHTAEVWLPVTDFKGEIIGVMARITDVTERARLQEEIKHYAEGLEEMVEERTRELKESQAQLMRSERLAAMGELAAVVAHEVRTPLNAMSINLQLFGRRLRAGGDVSRDLYRETLELLGYELERTNRVVEEFMKLARWPRASFTSGDLNGVVWEVTELLSGAASRAGVKLVFRPAAGLPKVRMNRDHIKQMLLNVILNGIQAMPDGGEMRVTTDLGPSDEVLIAVADSGSGIAYEHQSQIFSPFFTTREEGTGLGLPIVARIVKEHGGEVTFTSRPGKGTTFFVTLPVNGGPEGQAGQR